MPSPAAVLAVLAGVAGSLAPSGAALPQEPDAGPPAAVPEQAPPARTPLLDVPFVPQDVLLCGGAAAAMVLRYWGDGSARPREFAHLVRPAEGGIRTGELAAAIRDRGWRALPFRGDPSLVAGHLERGRPVVALLAAGEDAFHYVVVLAWTEDGVVLHDPAEGPFRVESVDGFRRRWAAGEEWSLLILPGAGGGEAATPVPPPVPPPAGPDPAASTDAPCQRLAEEAALRVRDGDPAGARTLLDAAEGPCAASPAVLRERAGLAFREEEWSRAASLAARAARLDPDHAYGWRLLASSRYLAGDETGALAAWNRVGEPRIRAVEIEGLRRTRYGEAGTAPRGGVVGLVDLHEGDLLTPSALLRARRRLALLPAAAGTEVRFRPLESGEVRVEAAVAERPVVPTAPLTLLSEGLRAGLRREGRVRAASVLGRGELWTVTGRWWESRPAVGAALEIPTPAGLPGVARLEGRWDRRTYALDALPGAPEPPGAGDGDVPVEEESLRVFVGLRDWATPTLLLSGGVGAEEWTGRGSHLVVAVGGEYRRADDRLGVDAELAGRLPVDGGSAFGALTVLGGWRSALRADPWLLSGRLGARLATPAAPLGLRAGAGSEPVAYALLRGHALLDDGVVQGPVFGRTLLHGGVELRRFLFRAGPATLEGVLFLDAAVAWDPPDDPGAAAPDAADPGFDEGVVHADPGTGLRMDLPGTPGFLRLDLARNLRAGRWHGSAGWRVPWHALGRWWPR